MGTTTKTNLKKTRMKTKTTKVFVYYDADHGDLAVFSTMQKAKDHADKAWPGSVNEEWEDCGDMIMRHPYEHIYTCMVE